MKLQLPKSCLSVMKRLTDAGYSVHLVGGCVRDMCRNVTPHDFDMTTSATPEEMLSVFQGYKIIPTGLKHGTVTVLEEGEPYEITTYRVDGDYTDGRHPDSVVFTRNLTEDLARRDFTVNAIAFDGSEITDPFGGRDDIRDRIIRAVGEPERRFTEDALRIMRALRFSATLGYRIEKETSEALFRLAASVTRISPERVREEFLKLVGGEDSFRVLTVYRDALFAAIPALSCTALEWEKKVKAAAYLHADSVLALAVLALRDKASYVNEFFGSLRFDKKSQMRASDAITILQNGLPSTPEEAGHLCSVYSPEAVSDGIRLGFSLGNGRSQVAYDSLESFLSSGHPYRIRDLAIRGDTLLTLGAKPGEEVGALLNTLLSNVIDGLVDNNEIELKKSVVSYLQEKR